MIIKVQVNQYGYMSNITVIEGIWALTWCLLERVAWHFQIPQNMEKENYLETILIWLEKEGE